MKRMILCVIVAAFIAWAWGGSTSVAQARKSSSQAKDQKTLRTLVRRDDGKGVRAWLAGGRSPAPELLIDAVGKNKLKALQAFLDAGIDVNASYDLFGPKMAVTLLGIAIDKGRVDAVRLLLAAGADPSIPSLGRPLAIAAAEKGRVELLTLLGKNVEIFESHDAMGMTPLHYAVVKGRAKAARFLLDRGVDRNPPDEQGLTPLYWAAQRGDLKMVSLLLEAGADANACSHNGVSPLMAAAQKGNGKVVEALLAAGADPDLQAKNGMKAVDYAHGIDAVITPLTAASTPTAKPVAAELVEDGKVYEVGTPLIGPCEHSGAIPADAGCGATGTEVMIYTTLRTSGASYTIGPPRCEPARVELNGRYRAVVNKIVTPWKGSDCYELKASQGHGKQMVYFQKDPRLTTEEIKFEVVGDSLSGHSN